MSSAFLSTKEAVCPPDLLVRARSAGRVRVAIADAGAALPMEAAKLGVDEGLIEPVFVGSAAAIRAEADTLGWDISGFEVHDAEGEQAAGDLAADICGQDKADVLMKGKLHSDVFMRAALRRDAGLRTGQRLVHIFHISPPNGGRPLLISDAAVNVAPDMITRQTALQLMVDLFGKLGNDHPKIAVLSATESVLPAVPSSTEGRELAVWAKENIANADVTGPLALDLILSEASAATKGMADDKVAGKADGVIVPDIVSGNTLFKSLVYLAGGCAAGLVLGAKVPLLLTSRADPPAARLASMALAAIARG